MHVLICYGPLPDVNMRPFLMCVISLQLSEARESAPERGRGIDQSAARLQPAQVPHR